MAVHKQEQVHILAMAEYRQASNKLALELNRLAQEQNDAALVGHNRERIL